MSSVDVYWEYLYFLLQMKTSKIIIGSSNIDRYIGETEVKKEYNVIKWNTL